MSFSLGCMVSLGMTPVFFRFVGVPAALASKGLVIPTEPYSRGSPPLLSPGRDSLSQEFVAGRSWWRFIAPCVASSVASFPTGSECVAVVAGCACFERGCWFARAAVGYVVCLRIRVGVSRRLREPTCGVAFTGAGLWSAEPVLSGCLVQAPNHWFCKPFLGVVRGGTVGCSSLTSWRLRGAGWFCLWGLDLVEFVSAFVGVPAALAGKGLVIPTEPCSRGSPPYSLQ
ncbi:hypothetical protein Taro_038529, partial [Colocasia esculenta]|nr:hypothetical protein [Colocasia esculenta]